jgi:hypothetical protein
MRLVADENVPMKAVLLFREKGHDVLSISESLPQTADEDILKTAERDGSHNPQLLTTIIVDAVQSRSDWAGHFAVVEPGRIRMREL